MHIGGARTALFSWAYARRHGGKFILRIEDTDLERSTELSVNAILEGMKWLGLDWDEGPFFQMQRLPRYQEVAGKLVAAGHAYPCWATKQELEELRARQRQNNQKPRYDGRWRPERAQGLKKPEGMKPVIRFRTPEEGEVGWHDLVKGPISFPNGELDDLVLLRADGVPTYNFGVVVDDLDMEITHVIRGDDHVNNTPRQLHIFNALVELGEYVTQFYSDRSPPADLLAEHVTDAIKPALRSLAERFATVEAWTEEGVKSAFEGALKAHGLKMPELAMPARLLVTGRTQTPSLDAVLELLGRETVLARLAHHLGAD